MVDEYKKEGLVVLAVNAWDEDKEVLKQYVQQNDFKHRVLLNGSPVVERYAIPNSRVPTVFWIDRQGTVVEVELGSGNVPRLEKYTKQLVTGKG